MQNIRLRFGDLDGEDTAEAFQRYAATHGLRRDALEIRPPGTAEGAALADAVLVALIAAGASVTVSLITAFAGYLAERRKERKDRDAGQAAKGDITIVIRGLSGTATVQVTAGKVDEANVRKALEAVEPVQELAYRE
jgi:hypothetical protein